MNVLRFHSEIFIFLTLEPKHVSLYTWENPAGDRIFVWNRGSNKEILNDLRKDMGGEFSPSEDISIYWTSFLDGMQRVLLFTEEKSLAEGAQISNLFEIIQQEITISMCGIGVSVVNNAQRKEIIYMGIASSGIYHIILVAIVNGILYTNVRKEAQYIAICFDIENIKKEFNRTTWKRLSLAKENNGELPVFQIKIPEWNATHFNYKFKMIYPNNSESDQQEWQIMTFNRPFKEKYTEYFSCRV